MNKDKIREDWLKIINIRLSRMKSELADIKKNIDKITVTVARMLFIRNHRPNEYIKTQLKIREKLTKQLKSKEDQIQAFELWIRDKGEFDVDKYKTNDSI